jgi:hypothetical protein
MQVLLGFEKKLRGFSYIRSYDIIGLRHNGTTEHILETKFVPRTE